MKKENEKLNGLYLSIDVESDGPTPGKNNLLSVGAAAFCNQSLIGTYTANLDFQSGCSPNKRTMDEFWNRDAKHKALYEETRKNTISIEKFSNDFVKFCKDLQSVTGKKLVMVAAPAVYDYKWIDYALNETLPNGNPFGHSPCVDMRSFVFSQMDRPFYTVSKRTFPKEWFSGRKHTHIAIDDAIEQGELWINILKHYSSNDK